MEKPTFDELPSLICGLQKQITDLTAEFKTLKPLPEKEKADGYMSRKQVCSHLNISLPTLHKLMKQGKMQAYHIAGRTLFKRNEVEQALQPVTYDLTRRSNAGRKPKAFTE